MAERFLLTKTFQTDRSLVRLVTYDRIQRITAFFFYAVVLYRQNGDFLLSSKTPFPLPQAKNKSVKEKRELVWFRMITEKSEADLKLLTIPFVYFFGDFF